MAVKLGKQSRRLAVMTLAISTFALPSLASAEPEDGGRTNWRDRSEEGARQARAENQDTNQDSGGQSERHAPPEQTPAAPAPQAAPPQQSVPPPQADWSGGGGNSWGGGHRDRSADQDDYRRDRNDRNDASEAAPRAPQQQPAQPGWAGRPGQTENADANRDGSGRNWTDSSRNNHEGRDRHQHDGRHRDRTGGYVSGGYYYGNISGDNQNYNDRNRDDHQWNRQWRNNSSYNWYSYRSSHPSYYRLGTYYSPYRNYSYRRLSIGFFLQNLFFGQNYRIQDPPYYRLPEVYGPYRWVRYYDDAVLVDIYSGEVVDVIYDFFW